MINKLLVSVLLSIAMAPAFAYDLSQHLWRDRLLVLVASDPKDPDLNKQLLSLEKAPAEVEDRDLRVIRLFARSGWIDRQPLGEEDVAQLRRRFDVSPGQRLLILVGLDGGIKRRAELSTKLGEVFEEIDAMPMRRAELLAR